MSSIIDGVERFFDGMGLMTGPNAIPKRMIVGALAGAFLVTYLKPSLMFEAGQPKPWSITATQTNEMSTTPVPWFFAPIAGAIVGGVLI
jgi:hypothetical protein